MTLTDKEVLHVARLAQLELSDEDLPRMQGEINEILNHVERLQKVSSLGVVPTLHVHGEINAFRDDIIRDSIPLEKIEMNAPDFKACCFRVPRII